MAEGGGDRPRRVHPLGSGRPIPCVLPGRDVTPYAWLNELGLSSSAGPSSDHSRSRGVTAVSINCNKVPRTNRSS